MAGRRTPVMQQFADAKRAYPDAILFFRMGDFYEMFEDDAVLAARLLELVLTSRNKGKPDEVPMAGVPHHAAHGYIARLLELGYQVAICEQMADPATVKGIVPREVVRVITPGTVTDRDQLDASTNNWLGAVEPERDGAGLALLDLSTGELRAAMARDLSALLAELGRAAPRELLVGGAPEGLPEAVAALRAALPGAAVREDRALDDAEAPAALGALASDAAGLAPAARAAVARALRYARACNPGVELPIAYIGRWEPSDALVIDPSTQRHLELALSARGTRDGSLLGVIDRTRSPAGARRLRRQLLAPLVDVARIRRRLARVEALVNDPALREQLAQALAGVGDLERLSTRAALGEATPRDLGAIRDGLVAAKQAIALLTKLGGGATLGDPLFEPASADTLDELAEALGRALVERPPAQPKDGAVFVTGYDRALDEEDELRRSGSERMVELEARLKRETGIGTLKVRFTRVFGWYIEVSRSQAGRAPEGWRRKQTVATGERYTIAELDDLADRILHAEERRRERELELLGELTRRAGAASSRLRALSALLARWDVAGALAEVAHRFDYVRPEVDTSSALLIEDGRHPVVERLAAAGRFVPNDVRLDLEGERLWVITGPNMAGKSTLLRQTALTVILAQMGSYVPARSARVGVVDRVLSRVGASDDLSRGESTFMVEMRETATILRAATARSLVIVDEIGRGTSTLDGLAIAWAVAEHLDAAIGCRALF
ncbi:MAG: DNA mismatch repair protein MutS, partial [Sorangiineae bacterium]|nr:DNA mismatch repair protein MutS [Sorangiineae bacterium]